MKFGGQPTPWSDERIDGLRCRTVAQTLIDEQHRINHQVKSETERRADAMAAHILALREMPDDMRELSVRMECEFLMREVWRTAWLSGFRAAAAGARDEHLNAVKSA